MQHETIGKNRNRGVRTREQSRGGAMGSDYSNRNAQGNSGRGTTRQTARPESRPVSRPEGRPAARPESRSAGRAEGRPVSRPENRAMMDERQRARERRRREEMIARRKRIRRLKMAIAAVLILLIGLAVWFGVQMFRKTRSNRPGDGPGEIGRASCRERV